MRILNAAYGAPNISFEGSKHGCKTCSSYHRPDHRLLAFWDSQHLRHRSQVQMSGPHWTALPLNSWIKGSGNEIHVSAKAFNITWGNDPRFWRWAALPAEESDPDLGLSCCLTEHTKWPSVLETKFQLSCQGLADEFGVGAELLQVNWMEVHGNVGFSHFQSGQAYEIFYLVKFKVDAFGWHSSPIKFKVMTTTGEKHVVSKTLQAYREVAGKMHEIRGGEFTVPHDAKGSVRLGIFEVESDWWKGSMILEGVKFRPKK
ncbi:hypothetical protein ACLOJK_032725 [Asimina triloba]